MEDVNHRFTLDVLTKDFMSHDLGVSAKNLRNDRQNSNDILDRIDKEEFTKRLKSLLEIRNRDEQPVTISEEHRREIKEYNQFVKEHAEYEFIEVYTDEEMIYLE